jgi:hypothetical protein
MNLPHKIILPAFLAIFLTLSVFSLQAETATSENNSAIAQQTDNPQESVPLFHLDKKEWGDVSQALLFLYIASTLVEAGLGVVFRWRIWMRYLDEKGFKIPLVIMFSFWLVECSNYDPVGVILKALLDVGDKVTDPVTKQSIVIEGMDGLCTQILSTLIVAGGSAGVIAIYRKLRLREGERENEEKKNKERSKRRFKLIKITRKNAAPDTTIQVLLDDEMIGTVLADKSSYAAFAGYEIAKGEHKLALKGQDKDGNPIEHEIVSKFQIAPGAIIEFEGTL